MASQMHGGLIVVAIVPNHLRSGAWRMHGVRMAPPRDLAPAKCQCNGVWYHDNRASRRQQETRKRATSWSVMLDLHKANN
jgi:hypothetical protein